MAALGQLVHKANLVHGLQEAWSERLVHLERRVDDRCGNLLGERRKSSRLRHLSALVPSWLIHRRTSWAAKAAAVTRSLTEAPIGTICAGLSRPISRGP